MRNRPHDDERTMADYSKLASWRDDPTQNMGSGGVCDAEFLTAAYLQGWEAAKKGQPSKSFYVHPRNQEAYLMGYEDAQGDLRSPS
jgi:hypothetical protein